MKKQVEKIPPIESKLKDAKRDLDALKDKVKATEAQGKLDGSRTAVEHQLHISDMQHKVKMCSLQNDHLHTLLAHADMKVKALKTENNHLRKVNNKQEMFDQLQEHREKAANAR